MVTAPSILEVFTAVIIDSGVLMDVRMFQSALVAELYTLKYINAEDEVKKRGGNPAQFRSYRELVRWMEKNPSFSAHVVYNRFNLNPSITK